MLAPRTAAALLAICLAAPILALTSLAAPGTGPALVVPHAPAEAIERPARYHLQWVRELPPLQPAWPDQPKLQFDAAYRPVAHNGLLFVSSSRTDGVTAYDLATGAERWRFVAEGPVRFAPVG